MKGLKIENENLGDEIFKLENENNELHKTLLYKENTIEKFQDETNEIKINKQI